MTAIYTIGYAGRPLPEFSALLARHEIAYIVDVRSAPYSKVHPEYSKDALHDAMQQAGFGYVYMGDLLGGRPGDPSCYTGDGKVDYERVKTRDFFQRGIARLQQAVAGGHRVALLCSELKPHECHRAKLIGVALLERGQPVLHIDEDGELRTQDEVMDRLRDKPYRGGQQTLFGDAPPPPSTSRKSYNPEPPDEP